MWESYSLTVESLLEILTLILDVHSVTNVIRENKREYFFNMNVRYCKSVT